MPAKRSIDTGKFVRRDPPLPPLSSPDPVTIHDLSPEDRARAIIYQEYGGTRKWRFPNGQ